MATSALPPCPADIDPVEWQLRLELAACYRLFDWMGWTTLIYNHISLRVPGSTPQFLINPFGLNYNEVTARNLVKIDVEGRKLDASPHPVNAAGFVIHSAIHEARDDAHCIAHTHSTAGMAVACKASGLRHDNFNSALLYGRVAYHDFEGVTTDLAERPRLVASIGDRPILILRNHGLLTTGATIPEAFNAMHRLELSCKTQIAAMSCNTKLIEVPADVVDATYMNYQPHVRRPFGLLDWPALLRKLDRIDPSFRD